MRGRSGCVGVRSRQRLAKVITESLRSHAPKVGCVKWNENNFLASCLYIHFTAPLPTGQSAVLPLAAARFGDSIKPPPTTGPRRSPLHDGVPSLARSGR